LEEKDKQLPSWNRRGVAQRRGGRWIETRLTTTPAFGHPSFFNSFTLLANERVE